MVSQGASRLVILSAALAASLVMVSMLVLSCRSYRREKRRAEVQRRCMRHLGQGRRARRSGDYREAKVLLSSGRRDLHELLSMLSQGGSGAAAVRARQAVMQAIERVEDELREITALVETKKTS